MSACFVDLLKPGRDADLVTFHFHHGLLDQKCQGAFNFLSSPAGTELIDWLRHLSQHRSLADRLQGAVGDQVHDFVCDHRAARNFAILRKVAINLVSRDRSAKARTESARLCSRNWRQLFVFLSIFTHSRVQAR